MSIESIAEIKIFNTPAPLYSSTWEQSHNTRRETGTCGGLEWYFEKPFAPLKNTPAPPVVSPLTYWNINAISLIKIGWGVVKR